METVQDVKELVSQASLPGPEGSGVSAYLPVKLPFLSVRCTASLFDLGEWGGLNWNHTGCVCVKQRAEVIGEDEFQQD